MKYEIIDLNAWERGKLFCYFTEKLRNVMSMTADIDVTPLLSFVRANGMKFYPAMMWTVSKAVNARAEFRYGRDSRENLIRWDAVSPYYADFHKDERKLCETFHRIHRRFLFVSRAFPCGQGKI